MTASTPPHERERGYLTRFERALFITLLLMFLVGLPRNIEWWIHFVA